MNNMKQVETGNNIYEVEITPDLLRISKSEIELSIGYPENTLPEYFNSIIKDITGRFSELCEIKAGYRIAGMNKPGDRSDGLIIENIFFETDRIVVSQIKKSGQAAIFACTIGSKMERWSKQLLAEGDPAKSYLVDCMASLAVESAVNSLHDFIGKQMKEQGLKITNRYSPGYCKWPVNDQHNLFSLLPDNFCGIKLNESALMSPIKSVSGIIGIGKDVEWREYLCDKCGVNDCTHRIKRLERLRDQN